MNNLDTGINRHLTQDDDKEQKTKNRKVKR